MSAPNTTPGPWFYDERADCVVTATEIEDGGDIVCMGPDMESSAVRWPANRSLIAAAPELYEALEDFDNWFCGFNPDDQASRMEGRKVVIRARAALARARGES